MPIHPALIAAALSTFAAAAANADSCEALRAEIEAKIRDAGVQIFSVKTVDVASDVPGQVVGSCGQGNQKIVYLKGVNGSTAAAPGDASSPLTSPPAIDRPPPMQSTPNAIMTECKSGFVPIRGECKKL